VGPSRTGVSATRDYSDENGPSNSELTRTIVCERVGNRDHESHVVIHREFVRVRLGQGYGATSVAAALRLNIIIHAELVRVGTQPQGVVFLLFHLQPVRDEVGIEDVAFEQEIVVLLQRFHRASE
jgi:hypothetical protein